VPCLRRQLLPGGHLPVQHPRERIRFRFRRLFLRGRFAPFAVQLTVVQKARRSPGKKVGNGCRLVKGDAGMLGEWGTVFLIAVVVLAFLFAGGGGG